MATAMRIQTLDDNRDPVATHDFERYEVEFVRAYPEAEYSIQAAQNGTPTVILRSDANFLFHRLPLRFRVHGNTTLAKLYGLRNHCLGGQLVRVYTHYIDDDSMYFDGILDMPRIPEQHIFSGEDAGGEIVEVNFLETPEFA